MEFGKIDTLFERDQDFVVDTTKLKDPVIAMLKEWCVTEKLNGVNCRVMLGMDGVVTVGGRTDNAQMPTDLVELLQRTFTADKMQAVFWTPDAVPVVLYGEGYGAGIQKGGKAYRPKDKSFRLFDVLVGPWWLTQDNVNDVASKLGIKTAPYLGSWTLDEIVKNVLLGIQSVAAFEDSGLVTLAEGIVGRPAQPLFWKDGRRLLIKLKTKDFGKDVVREAVKHIAVPVQPVVPEDGTVVVDGTPEVSKASV